MGCFLLRDVDNKSRAMFPAFVHNDSVFSPCAHEMGAESRIPKGLMALWQGVQGDSVPLPYLTIRTSHSVVPSSRRLSPAS